MPIVINRHNDNSNVFKFFLVVLRFIPITFVYYGFVRKKLVFTSILIGIIV